jgi:SnoaL-like domain
MDFEYEGDMTKTLEERIAATEALQEIANLKARYLNACDGGWNRPSHDADAVAETFALDARWEAEGFPALVGRDAIRAAFKSFAAQAPFAFHSITNPLIKVDGDNATGEWHLTEQFTNAKGDEFSAAGIYSDQFVRIEGAWLIKSLSLCYAFNGPCEPGWAAGIRRARKSRSIG